ncbi:MAG: STAS domain-containing protein [Anaerolineae bacterium]|nr:STAS domain-containing protein [Anaerolineae bacterium]MCI0608747.1 STAS domain-containing protein [Anaerolineae bacterium]
MNISVTKEAGNVEVTVLRVEGQLDGQSYQDLIVKARELSNAGSHDFILDLTDLTYISSAGLVALHSIALMLKGEEMPDTEHGWSAYRSMGRGSEAGMQTHIKLLNPRDEVRSVLEMVGFDRVFEIFIDLNEAVKSF